MLCLFETTNFPVLQYTTDPSYKVLSAFILGSLQLCGLFGKVCRAIVVVPSARELSVT